MKRYIILIASLVAMSAVAQSPIESILQSVASNNNSIKATQQDVSAAQTELSAENCLKIPLLSLNIYGPKSKSPVVTSTAFLLCKGSTFPPYMVNAANSSTLRMHLAHHK